jgi:hypothetical protein
MLEESSICSGGFGQAERKGEGFCLGFFGISWLGYLASLGSIFDCGICDWPPGVTFYKCRTDGGGWDLKRRDAEAQRSQRSAAETKGFKTTKYAKYTKGRERILASLRDFS